MVVPFAYVLTVILLPALTTTAQAVPVSGTPVALVPPPGFVAAARFPGFEHADLQASIMVTQVPGPFAALTAGMTRSGLASRGMTLLESERSEVNGRTALLLHVAQSAAGTEFLKWMLVSGDDQSSVMIVGTYPKSAKPELGQAIKTSLLSLRWGATAPADPFEGLPFRVSPSSTLKIAGRMGNMVMLTETGRMGPQGVDSPLFVVAQSIGEANLGDLKAFAERRAGQTRQLKSLRISQARSTSLGGTAAYELTGEGTDAQTGRSVTLYQLVMPDEPGYILMQGLVASSRAAALIPEFRRVAETFTRR